MDNSSNAPTKRPLELRIPLRTESKLCCSCPTYPRQVEEPNTRCCPVCLGLPGSFRRLNTAALKHAWTAIEKLHCQPRPEILCRQYIDHDPAAPSGFRLQIKISAQPAGGCVEITSGGRTARIKIIDVSLEEMPGKRIRQKKAASGGSGKSSRGYKSLLDYNNYGQPLLLIVSEPLNYTSPIAPLFVREVVRTLDAAQITRSDLRPRLTFNPLAFYRAGIYKDTCLPLPV